MARIYPIEYTKPIPSEAPRRTHQGEAQAQIKVRGKLTWCPVTASGTTARISSGKWGIEYVDANGRTRRTAGFKDKEATQAKLADIVRQVERERAGIVTAEVKGAGRPLQEWAGEYTQRLADDGCGPAHVASVSSMLGKILTGCGWEVWADIEADSLASYLAKRRAGKLGPRIRAGTTFQYHGAAKAFASWLANRLKVHDPLAEYSRETDETDKAIRRRALSRADWDRWITAVRGSDEAFALSGMARAALYQFAATTGLRVAELRSLTTASLLLDGSPPAVRVEASYSKRKRWDTVPLPPSTVVMMREYIASLPSGSALWPVGSPRWVKLPRNGAAHMVRADLELVGIPFVDLHGCRYDFHALRGQFATDLCDAGVGLVDAQRLMRHSTPVLTANTYTRRDLNDLAKASAKLDEHRSA